MSDDAIKPNADIKTLERLVDRMKRDVANGSGLNSSAVLSLCSIIEDAIGAPINWPSRVAGVAAADNYYRSSPDLRHAFNAGVKWAVEAYRPTTEPSKRFG